MAIADKLTQLNNVKLAIKQAIVNKGVSMDSVAFTDYATKIDSIIKSTGNAAASDVLNGKTFSNASSNSLTGSMTNNGAVTKTFTPSESSQSYTIPKGYHNGSGKVTCKAIPNTYSPVVTVFKNGKFTSGFSPEFTYGSGTVNSSGIVCNTGAVYGWYNKMSQLTPYKGRQLVFHVNSKNAVIRLNNSNGDFITSIANSEGTATQDRVLGAIISDTGIAFKAESATCTIKAIYII